MENHKTLRVLFARDFTAILLVSGLGVEDRHSGLILVGLRQRERTPIETKNAKRANNKFEMPSPLFLLTLSLCLPGCRRVCKLLVPRAKIFTLENSVRA